MLQGSRLFLATLASLTLAAWMSACSGNGLSGALDESPLATITLPTTSSTGCEVTILYPLSGLSWPWRWDWNATTRTLRTQDGGWALRYDAKGRLVEDVRQSPAFLALLAYDDANSVLRSRIVFRDGRFDTASSFTQHVEQLESARAIELRGDPSNAQPRAERLEFDETGTLRRFVENGLVTTVAYATDGRFMRTERPNRSEMVCQYADDGTLRACQEDGTFDPANPGQGEARDGTADVHWSFSPECRPLQTFAAASWFALPLVAPLSECLRQLPPWRPTAQCRFYAITIRSNKPSLLKGYTAMPGPDSSWTECNDNPCRVKAGERFASGSIGGSARPVHYSCKEEGGSAMVERDGPDLVLDPIVNDWTCHVEFAPPPQHTIAWSSNIREDRLNGWTKPLGDRTWPNQASCPTSPCQVNVLDDFALTTADDKPALFRCWERVEGGAYTEEHTSDFQQLRAIRASWDCTVEFPPPAVHTVSWAANVPDDRINGYTSPTGAPPWTICQQSPCPVTAREVFAMTTVGSRNAHFRCEESRTGRILEDYVWSFSLGAIVNDWSCKVNFDPPVEYGITWVTNNPDKVGAFVRALGAGTFSRCPDGQPCRVHERDEFTFTTSSPARFVCVDPGNPSNSKDSTAYANGQASEFALGPVVNNWRCTVTFAPGSPPPPTLYTITWRVFYDGQLNREPDLARGFSDTPCSERSCRVRLYGSIVLRIPPGSLASFRCHQVAAPWIERRQERATEVRLENITADWECDVGFLPV